jgi:haloacetate dehalogenase
MATSLVKVMSELGFHRFSVVGHDRGGRAAYRLALDHPEAVIALAVVSILPTFAMWARLRDNAYAMKAFHWFLLAQPTPFPERLLQAAGRPYLHATLREWTKSHELSVFDPRALAAYEHAYALASTIEAACGDYRAGWTIDRLHDQADLDAGRTIDCPVLALWGGTEFPDAAEVLLEWQRIAKHVMGHELPCGHFAAEEEPDTVYVTLQSFLTEHGMAAHERRQERVSRRPDDEGARL